MNSVFLAREMVPALRVLARKPENMCSITGTHIEVEGKT